MEQDSEKKLSPDRAIDSLKKMETGVSIQDDTFLKALAKVILDEVKEGKFSIITEPIIVKNTYGSEIGRISDPIKVKSIS